MNGMEKFFSILLLDDYILLPVIKKDILLRLDVRSVSVGFQIKWIVVGFDNWKEEDFMTFTF